MDVQYTSGVYGDIMVFVNLQNIGQIKQFFDNYW